MTPIKESLDIIIAIFAVVGAVFACGRALRPIAHRVSNALDRLEMTSDAVLGKEDSPGLVARFDEFSNSFSLVRREVMPNGGSSMSDRMSQLLGEMRVRLDFDLTTGHFSMDRNGHMVWANKAFHHWFGTRPDDVLGMRWLGLIHPDEREGVAQDVYRAVKDGRFTRINARFQDGAHGWLTIHAEMTPLRGSSGHLIGFNGFVQVEPERRA